MPLFTTGCPTPRSPWPMLKTRTTGNTISGVFILYPVSPQHAAAGPDHPEEHPRHQDPARDPRGEGEHLQQHAGPVSQIIHYNFNVIISTAFEIKEKR